MDLQEELTKLPIFQDAAPKALARVAELVRSRTFAAEEPIFFRGDPGNSMFAILEGRVAVTLTNAEGVEYPLAQLKEGDIFGEMALLTGEPRSANVKALTGVKAVEITQETFAALVRIMPEVNTRLLKILAGRIGKTTDQWQEEKKETKEILSTLLSSYQGEPETDHFPGVVKWTRELNQTIQKLGANKHHVLISGEAGVGRELVGKLIHQQNGNGARPFFALDCANPPPVFRETACRVDQEAHQLLSEAAQEAALFGHEAGSAVYARGTRRGYIELSNGGSLLLRNIEYLTPKVQLLLLNFLKEHAFSRIGEEERLLSQVRILATAGENMEAVVAEGKFLPELLKILEEEVVKLIPLRERKKDIPVLAEHFLVFFRDKAHKDISGFSKAAMNALVDYDWPSNLIELRQVIDRAVAICRGRTIEEEHIFLDLTPFNASGKINLLKIDQVETLAQHRHFPGALLYLSVPLFIFLILYTLLGPRQGNVANLIAWSLLWPALLLSIIFSARSWCQYCPMHALSSILAYLRRRPFAVPGAIKKYGIWVGVFGFILVFWLEHALHMMQDARATGALFLSVLGGAVITAILFGRRVWCLYLCPLGRMIGQFTTLSIIELRGNSNVCVSQCQTHDCIKEKNCPMGLHPSSEKTRHDCILCLSCVKKCRHKSVHLDALLPLSRVANQNTWEWPRALFSVLLAAAPLALKLPETLRAHSIGTNLIPKWFYAETLGWELVSFLLLSAVFTGVVYAISAASERRIWNDNFLRAGYAYLPLAFLSIFNIYFRELVIRGAEIPPRLIALIGLSNYIPPAWVTPNLVTLKGLFPLIILFGWVCSLYLLKGIKTRHTLSGGVYRGHQIFMTLTAILYLILL